MGALTMNMKTLNPETARQQLESGAVMVDIRPSDEYAREHIAQAVNIQIEQLPHHPGIRNARAVIFYCRSGNRTRMLAQALQASVKCDAYVLEGGLDAWKKADLPVIADRSQPLELQRQVQIVAGLMIVLGTALGVLISPWWLLLSGFVGLGLVFAGVSGFCGLARVLLKMPWNKRAISA